ncbi:site-specific integrase, partial [Kitasatospora sp. NPDC057015]|uniref:site-specific integrase n=1 Tax=Kitasatospora sp. NPDC057015 TaxID=3346001 RepID=UPI00363BDD3C
MAGLRLELTRLGYASSSIREAAAMMGRLSGWMQARGLTASELIPQMIEEFLDHRREYCRTEQVARRWVKALVRFLREAEVIPLPELVPGTPVKALVADYREFLRHERALAAESVRCYGNHAEVFLSELPPPLGRSLAGLDAATVTTFIVGACDRVGSVESAKALVTALRSLLRFLHLHGHIPTSLAGAVPAVAGWRLSALPLGLDSTQVQALLGSCPTGTRIGLRDHAVLTLLARLGLRGGEAAALQIGDVDWRSGEVLVRGKGSVVERLPLPAEVGQVLAAYLTQGRPRCASTALFITERAPYRGLSPAAVRAITVRACGRAGLPRIGGHRFRHHLATQMLRAGASLPEVGQVLRHRSQLSTTVYAKVDHEALRTLARPWPG